MSLYASRTRGLCSSVRGRHKSRPTRHRGYAICPGLALSQIGKPGGSASRLPAVQSLCVPQNFCVPSLHVLHGSKHSNRNATYIVAGRRRATAVSSLHSVNACMHQSFRGRAVTGIFPPSGTVGLCYYLGLSWGCETEKLGPSQMLKTCVTNHPFE